MSLLALIIPPASPLNPYSLPLYPWQAQIFLLSPVFPFADCHMVGIIQYVDQESPISGIKRLTI